MKLAPPPLAIGLDDGFENTDLFGYKEFGERLANIVEALDSATVLVLDGPWGSGKTTFTQQWAGLLRQRGHAVAQFDAFAHDYQNDAFVALAGEIVAHSQQEASESLKKVKAPFLKAAAAVPRTLPSMTARVVLNLVTQGVLSPAVISKFIESIESAQTSQLEKRIENAHEDARTVEEFRKRLSELAGELAPVSPVSPTAETTPTEEAPRKLIFIIDELDRCRPTFALSLLERVKHLFSVDEICFVLVVHLPELARMVEKAYGVTSGQRYLEKFYHLRVTLPVARKHHARPHMQYLAYLLATMNVRMDATGILVEALSALAGAHGVHLRTLEHVARNVALVGLATNRLRFRSAPLIAGLCVMRVVDPDLYEKARTGRLRTNEAMRFLRFDEWHRESVESVEWLKDAWIYATATDEELKNTPDHERIRKRDWGDTFAGAVIRSDMITKTCEYIDDLWQIELA